jgi:zinc and cadmium transporter
MSWVWPVVATLVASSGALLGSGLVLWLGRLRPAALNGLLAVAVGTLLGAALLDLLPEALEHAPPKAVLWRFLLGIFAFLAFERLVRWRHTHEDHHHDITAAAPLVLWSDALHNLVDGFVIGAAFTGGMELGIATTLAVIAHEIPQEVGDFAVLLGAGMPWRKALLLNWLVQLPPVAAAGLTFTFASDVSGAIAWMLPLAAGSLVYIALADLVPSLHHRAAGRAALLQLALVALGVGLIAAVGAIGHH